MKFKDDDWKVREAAINAVVLLAKHGMFNCFPIQLIANKALPRGRSRIAQST